MMYNKNVNSLKMENSQLTVFETGGKIMITVQEIKAKMEQQLDSISDSIYNEMEKKLEEQMNKGNGYLVTLQYLEHKKVYIGFAFVYDRVSRITGISVNSSAWEKVLNEITRRLNQRLAEAGWKLDTENDCILVPIEQK